MGEDFDNHRRIFDGGDALQAAAAVRAVFDVDVEDPFEQPGPTPGAPAIWTSGSQRILSPASGWTGVLGDTLKPLREME